MSTLIRRTGRQDAPFARMDRLFDEWFRSGPFARAVEGGWDAGEQVIRIDEFRDGDTMVVKAEIPGVDPAKDIAVTVREGMLTITAERRLERDREEKGYRRHEIRYGAMTRSLPLPEGVAEGEITAAYRDGILEIRIPVPAEPEPQAPVTIPIASS